MPLTENEWDSVRSDFIHGHLSPNLRARFASIFPNEAIIPMINFDGLDPGQKIQAYNIYISNELGLEGGRKHSRSKKYKKTRRRRGSKKRRHGRKSRRHR
jgi:hypothetical protein